MWQTKNCFRKWIESKGISDLYTYIKKNLILYFYEIVSHVVILAAFTSLVDVTETIGAVYFWLLYRNSYSSNATNSAGPYDLYRSFIFERDYFYTPFYYAKSIKNTVFSVTEINLMHVTTRILFLLPCV